MTSISKATAFPKSVQPGIPQLPPCPPGWTQEPLGKYLFEQLRPIKMMDDLPYDLVTVKRARGGVVRRETLIGRDISVKAQFELRKDDFLISKRQIVHGACGIVPASLDGSIVSNEYAVLCVKPGLDLRFLSHLAHSVYFQQTCFHSSIGVHIEKMIFKLDRWFKWKFNLPPLSEQQRIAEILCTWDRAIETVEGLIANARKQKKALMQSLMTGKKRLSGFSDNWHWVKFSEIFERVRQKNDAGNTNVLTISAQNGLISQVKYFSKSIASEDVRGYTLLRHGDFAYNKSYSDGYPMGAIKPLERYESGIVSSLYICFRLTNGDYHHGFVRQYFEAGLFNRQISEIAQEGARNHGLLNVSVVDFFDASVHAPGHEEQVAIANVIDSAEQTELALINQIKTLRQEKAALMRQLLTGKRRVRVPEGEMA